MMADSSERPKALSNPPPEDLKKERDAFIRQFFRKGAQFTEELVQENERLRGELASAEARNAGLRAQLASDDAIRELLRTVERLEEDKKRLIDRAEEILEERSAVSNRYAEVEVELANLASLFVAISQLHASHSVGGVLRNIGELLSQLVGADKFGIYVRQRSGAAVVPVLSEGLPKAEAEAAGSARVLLSAFESGEPAIAEGDDLGACNMDRPAAVVPLRLDGTSVGVIAVFTMLAQKTRFNHEDHELFRLLGSHAAAALVKARLYSAAGRPLPYHEDFIEAES